MTITYKCDYCEMAFDDEDKCAKHEMEHKLKELYNNKIITFFNDMGEKLDTGLTTDEFDTVYCEAEYIYVKTLPASLYKMVYEYFGYQLPKEGWYKNTGYEYIPFDMGEYIQTAKNFEDFIKNT